ncbi:exodeoxyribonuclease III [Actinomyces dentalis]|uniref:exodeoxyribonuclease III n=2 Tax=Actinomyces dentalis TaxID=272548 RepID=UPI000420EEE1|nr:exodeoxyribonuclease III [Actinomyces dentalis]
MRLATWNVNSVRTRVDRVIAFLERENVDVLAMQEIKCRPEQFPLGAFAAAGYEVAVHGLNQWNGVAIASRVGLADVATSFPGQPAWAAKEGAEAVVEARALGATVGGSAGAGSSTDRVMPPKAGAAGAAGSAAGPGPAAVGPGPAAVGPEPVAVGPGPAATSEPVRLWSLYVPNGRELTHPHYEYKLAWLEALRHCVIDWLAADPDRALALAGDWNVAPRDEDVWDMSVFEGATHVSAPERAALAALARAGLTEVTRERVTNYTYWDYQRLRFPRNEGMRIDFVYGSAALAARVTGAAIDRDERKGKGASDHVPVIVDLA